MIQRRAKDAKISAELSSHVPTGITAYLDNGGSLEHAQATAGHENPSTTRLFSPRVAPSPGDPATSVERLWLDVVNVEQLSDLHVQGLGDPSRHPNDDIERVAI